jgi:hypothetical protein
MASTFALLQIVCVGILAMSLIAACFSPRRAWRQAMVFSFAGLLLFGALAYLPPLLGISYPH